MKSINKSIFSICVGLAMMAACKKETPNYQQTTDSKDAATLSMQKALNGVEELVLFPAIEQRTNVFTVNYGGLGLPASDINVSFVQDAKALDSVNNIRVKKGLEPYLPFPANSYSFDKTAGIIKSGQVSSDNFTLIYKPEMFDLKKQYMLAVTASNSSGYKFRPGGSTLLFLAQVVEKPHVKTAWKASVSSIAPKESTGDPSALIDANVSTYWHSQTGDNSPKFPHWVEVDFGAEIYVTQIGLTRRQNNSNGFKTFDILGSKDGTTWELVATDQVMNKTELEMQKFSINPQYLKKIKLVIKNNFNEQNSTHLAEIDALGY